MRSVENEECGVWKMRSVDTPHFPMRSVEMRSVENEECGKGGVENEEWKMRSVENGECGKCGVWKMRVVENEECGNLRTVENFPGVLENEDCGLLISVETPHLECGK